VQVQQLRTPASAPTTTDVKTASNGLQVNDRDSGPTSSRQADPQAAPHVPTIDPPIDMAVQAPSGVSVMVRTSVQSGQPNVLTSSVPIHFDPS